MQNTSDAKAPEAGGTEGGQTGSITPAAPTAADLEDKLRNFPVPELQFRLLIKSIPELAG